MTLLFFSMVGIYIAFTLVLLSQNIRARDVPLDHWQPFVSIIVAARNEANTIATCLHSLVNLNYPKNKMEILVIDDHSSDHSDQVIAKFVSNHSNIRFIPLKSGEKKLPGKVGAVLEGIENSIGEIIFLTDADCWVPPNWVTALLNEFTDSVGLVGGFTLLHEQGQNTSLLGKIQALDWHFLLSIAAMSARLGKALSWMGNNMAFRREVYNQVGGYRALGFSLIEDFALINAVARKTKWSIKFICGPETAIHSKPVLHLKELYSQRKRWGTGIRMVRPLAKVLMICSLLVHLGMFCCFFVDPFSASIGFIALLCADFLLCLKGAIQLKRIDLLYIFLGFELFYIAYTISLPFLILFSSRVTWKNEIYLNKLIESRPFAISDQVHSDKG